MQPIRHSRRAVTVTALLFAATVFAIAACAPALAPKGEAATEPALTADTVVTPDGARLPLRIWPAENPTAVVVAVHGFNDYSNFMTEPAKYFQANGITVYAYDQRGFGAAPHHGLWPGMATMAGDLKTVSALVHARHPGTPVYLLGASMGGAVTMVAMTGEDPPKADGIVLSGPAVWARETMPFYQRWALWLGAHTMPWLTVTGKGLDIRPSDNIEMLRALGRDPLVIKETRIDAIHGMVDLMDAALASATWLDAKALILIGVNDEIIPAPPSREMLKRLPRTGAKRQTVAVYDNGFHMLLRDLQGETVWADIAAWIGDANAPLPSGAEAGVERFLAEK